MVRSSLPASADADGAADADPNAVERNARHQSAASSAVHGRTCVQARSASRRARAVWRTRGGIFAQALHDQRHSRSAGTG